MVSCLATLAPNAIAFDGRIEVVVSQGSEATSLLYTIGSNLLRVEVTGSSAPNPIDIIDLKSGALTLVFPHNRSFVRLKPGNANARTPVGLPTPPPGIEPQPNKLPSGAPPLPTPPGGLPPGIGPQPQGANAPGIPAMPNMPPMPMPMAMMPMEKLELKATGKKEKILGFACEQYEIKQRGETMEIWATDALLPYQPYIRNQPSRFGPRMIDEQWPDLLTAKKLFPLRASLRFDHGPAGSTGPERFHFEAKTITPGKISDEKLFQPPADYFEIQPLPF